MRSDLAAAVAGLLIAIKERRNNVMEMKEILSDLLDAPLTACQHKAEEPGQTGLCRFAMRYQGATWCAGPALGGDLGPEGDIRRVDDYALCPLTARARATRQERRIGV